MSSLPTELLAHILASLPPSTLLALHYTSRRFASLVSLTPQRLFSQTHLHDSEPPSLEWLLFLSMLERDHLLHNNLVCSRCTKTHDATHFSSPEQQKSPLARSCLGYEGKIWVCPHKSWNAGELQLLREGNLKVFHPSLWPVEPCRCLKDGMFLHTLFLHVESEDPGPLEARMKRMLGLSRSKRCEHMRLRDPEKKSFKHQECATLGCEGTAFACRRCIEPCFNSL